MSFISGQFFLFFLAACTVYFLVPKKVQWMVLLAANYIFYLCAGPRPVRTDFSVFSKFMLAFSKKACYYIRCGLCQ